MLRFGRYFVWKGIAFDLATGHPVEIELSGDAKLGRALFDRWNGRTLIDLDHAGGRVEIWERWLAKQRPARWSAVRLDFLEVLECARLGAPRAFDVTARTAGEYGFLRRALAREARLAGWLPIGADILGDVARLGGKRLSNLIADRSLVVFLGSTGLSGESVVALLKLAQRDIRPHVLVRSLTSDPARVPWPMTRRVPIAVHETTESFNGDDPAEGNASPSLHDEARARWAVLLQEAAGEAADTETVALAQVLAARDQTFEARALIARVPEHSGALAARATAIATDLEARAMARVERQLSQTGPDGDTARGWEMVEDVVGLLEMCQDVEDEHVALTRVGAFVRERLQASSVAFVAREGTQSRVLARVGSDLAALAAADRAIETGVSVPPARAEGPVETACPIRHAADVIGAVWCRWSAGTPVAVPHAATLLGVAAAATAPSVRLALTRLPVAVRANPVPELIGESAAMVAVRDAILRAAASPFPVVIEGESGCGKELVARAIHARSARRDKRFCPINCAALVDDLVESELFGHVRGAFTGASADRPGMFEEASGGTLFLDEIAELGGRVQAKLLRTLQEGEVKRLGEATVRKVDVRIVAATNRPLGMQVAQGAFRADLWYRLDVIRFTLPPLRERLDDVPLLVEHLWRGLQARTGSRARLSSTALGALASYDWPGNVRELQNVLASMLVATPRGGLIGPSALPAHVARVASLEPRSTLAAARRQFEERYVRAALARAGGRTATAARDLGLSRQGLAKLLGRLGISESRSEEPMSANVQ
jgi:DNA-binding NtrC family response regulator